jgi:hypothetical protein
MTRVRDQDHLARAVVLLIVFAGLTGYFLIATHGEWNWQLIAVLILGPLAIAIYAFAEISGLLSRRRERRARLFVNQSASNSITWHSSRVGPYLSLAGLVPLIALGGWGAFHLNPMALLFVAVLLMAGYFALIYAVNVYTLTIRNQTIELKWTPLPDPLFRPIHLRLGALDGLAVVPELVRLGKGEFTYSLMLKRPNYAAQSLGSADSLEEATLLASRIAELIAESS